MSPTVHVPGSDVELGIFRLPVMVLLAIELGRRASSMVPEEKKDVAESPVAAIEAVPVRFPEKVPVVVPGNVGFVGIEKVGVPEQSPFVTVI
jgi:hypothetical protein